MSQTPKKQEQVMPTISYQLTLPSSTDEIAPSELETLRKLFSRNGLEADIASNDPTKWTQTHLAVNFIKGTDGKYHVPPASDWYAGLLAHHFPQLPLDGPPA